jgi:hypothetical protein
MYCPQCSQSTVNAAQFCSKCGFPLENVKQLLANGGELKTIEEDKRMPEISERQKGIRQGIKLLLLCLVLLPLHMVTEGLLPSVENTNIDDLPHLLFDALLWVILLAGLARIFYALVFNRSDKNKLEEVQTDQLNAAASQRRLSSPGIPVSDFHLRQADTGDMIHPPNVTERTTSLLDDK